MSEDTTQNNKPVVEQPVTPELIPSVENKGGPNFPLDHKHNGYDYSRVEFEDLSGFLQVVSTVPTATPLSIYQQVLFYKSGTTKTIYVYDRATNTWLSITESTATQLGVFGDGSDGDVTISGDTTLSRDMYYSNLTINGGNLTTASYRVFVKNTLTITSGVIRNNGGAGGNATDGANARTGGIGGTAGVAIAAGSMPGGVVGAVGAGGGTGGQNEANGANGGTAPIGTLTNPSWGSSGVAPGTNKGGAGGDSGDAVRIGGTGSTSGNEAAASAAKNKYLTPQAIYQMIDIEPTITQILGSASSGGGGGGGGGASRTNGEGGGGGGGGGSGSPGGYMFIFARIIVNNVTSGIQSKGGAGGNGGNGRNATGTGNAGGGGGGQGGTGGTGGVILIVTQSYTGTGSLDVSGGAGGSAGTGGNGILSGLSGNTAQASVTGATGVSVTLTI